MQKNLVLYEKRIHVTYFSDVYRARQHCFDLLDLIRYFQNPREYLSIWV